MVSEKPAEGRPLYGRHGRPRVRRRDLPDRVLIDRACAAALGTGRPLYIADRNLYVKLRGRHLLPDFKKTLAERKRAI